jgi:hypothetical protein
MKPRLFLTTLALAGFLTGGCHLFSKKSSRPKDDASIAGETEESLHRRWVDKRVSELVAKGTAADAAHTQAEAEFRERFDFTGTAKK